MPRPPTITSPLARTDPRSSAASAVTGAGFLALALVFVRGWALPLDEAIVGWVAARRDCGTIAAAAAVSVPGAGEVSLALSAALAMVCLWRQRPRAAAALLLLY